MNKQISSALAQGDQTPVVLVGADNNEVRITSVELVEKINRFRAEEGNIIVKRHSDLMTSIKTEIGYLEKAGIGQRNFSLTSYIDDWNREKPCYSLNKAGVLQMLNKESAVVRYKTVQYIEKLEKANKNKPLTAREELRLHYQALEEQSEEIKEIKTEVADLKNNMPLFNAECKELQALVRSKGVEVLGGYKSKAYNDNSLRGKVYSDIQRQIKREFGVCRYEAIKRSQFEIAKQIIQEYKAPTVLITEISVLNLQTSLFDRKEA